METLTERFAVAGPRKYKREPSTRKDDRKKAKDLLLRVRERFKVMSEADQENRRLAMEDLKFVNEPGHQWDEQMKKERGQRPCYEFNKLRINGKRVINEIRANRPQGKVRAVEGGDKKTAELYEGLCRNIWNISDGDTVVDYAAEYQVDAGMGAWRVVTEYADDSAFDQDIFIRPIKNPFCLYVDPSCQDPMKRDAEDWILTERISTRAFDERYPKAERISFDDVEFDDEDEWQDSETVRIAEYWYKDYYDKEIWLIQGPQGPITVDSTSDEGQALAKQPGFEQIILRRRTVRCPKIMMCIVSGEAILEGPVECPGTQFPFVMIYGEYKVVDGKAKWWGLHRFAKDAQRSYNVSRTAIDETIAMAPQAKFWATPMQAQGHTGMWAEAHQKNFPFLLYNPDPQAPGVPQRMGGPDVPVALLNQAEVASQDIRDVTGLHEASFGEESKEKSGIALARKQNQAQIVTYNFPDNMAKGIRRTWEILVDWIPHVYDAERELRVIGADGAEDYQRVNALVHDPATGQTIRVNDLSVGKYDVTITVGPSFSTLRQEAAEVYGEIGSRSPELMQVAGDLVFKAMDLPFADEIAKRWQAILPTPIQQMISEGKEIPPEAQAVMAQAQQAMLQVQQQTALVQQAAQQVEQEKAASEKAKAEVQKAVASLEVKQAKFEAAVEKRLADLTVKEAALNQREAQLTGQQQQAEAQTLDLSEAKKAVADIDAMVASFMEAVADAMAKIKSESAMVIAMPKKSRLKGVRAVRENGALVAIPEYEGDADEPRIARVRASRGPDGSLVGVPEYEDQAAPTQPN